MLAIIPGAEAQQTVKIFRIGFLDDSTASNIAVRSDNFRQELSKLGWIEGRNIAIVDKILKGAKPADLLVPNLGKANRRLGRNFSQ